MKQDGISHSEARKNERRDEWISLAKRVGYNRAADIISAGDMSQEWMFAELIIAFAVGRRNGQDCSFDCVECGESLPVDETKSIDDYDDDWLLNGKPDGTVVPPASGRETIRTPNLNSANPSFAARLILYVRDKFGGDAPSIYRAAHISRKTYSAIIGNELRPVSKQVAIAFAFALKLSLAEAKELLRSAGHGLSDFMLEDIIYQACLIADVNDINRVNQILISHAAKPLFCQDVPARCPHEEDILQPDEDIPL